VLQCISRHLQPTIVESALCCPCLEPLFSLGSQTACTQCTFSTLPGVCVPGTGSQPSYKASPNRLRFTFLISLFKKGSRTLITLRPVEAQSTLFSPSYCFAPLGNTRSKFCCWCIERLICRAFGKASVLWTSTTHGWCVARWCLERWSWSSLICRVHPKMIALTPWKTITSSTLENDNMQAFKNDNIYTWKW